MVQNATFIDLDPKGNPYQFNGFGIRTDNAPLSPHTLQQTGGGMAGDPSFVNCRTGIKAIGTSVDIFGNIMENMRIGVSAEFCHTDVDIYDNIIHAKTVGIELSQTEPNAPRSINDNEITMTGPRGNGIEVNESLIDLPSTAGVIEDNIVSIDGFGAGTSSVGAGIHITSAAGYTVANNEISLSPLLFDGTGIHISGSDGGTVEQNDIDGGSASKNRGIWALNSEDILWDCNDIEDVKVGLQVDMPSHSLDGFRGNRFDNAQTGLLLRPGARISEQDQTGNQWSNSNTSSTSAIHEGDDNDVLQSVMRAEEPSSGTSIFWPESIQSSSQWFFDEMAQSGEPYICLQEVPPVRLKSFAEDNIASFEGPLDEPVEWLSAAYLYERVTDHNQLLNEPGYTAFYNQHGGSTVGQFAAIGDSTANLYEIGAADLSALNGNNSSLETKVADIRSVEFQIVGAPESAVPGLMAARTALYQDVGNIAAANGGIWDQVQVQRTTDAAQAVSQNANITTAYGFEANEQAVNGILLSTAAVGGFGYSQAETATLTNIANQCPLQGGNAVFRARAMLAGTVDSVFYDDDLICGMTSQMVQPPVFSQAVQSGFSIYPNPTKGEFTVVWDENAFDGTLVDIVVYDLLGQKIFEKRNGANMGRETVTIVNLAEGVYICKVFIDRKNVFTEDLVLVRQQ